MSSTRGEGRAPAEKAGRVIGRDLKKAAERKALDKRYTELAGEVSVTRIDPQREEKVVSTVLKWTVPADGGWHPIGSGPVARVASQFSAATVQVWTIESVEDEVLPRLAKVIGTGHTIPEGTEHIGSTGISGLVWHVFASVGGSDE